VRELQNVIERGILLAENDSLDLTLPEGPESLSNQPFADTPTMDELQKRYIRFILEKTGGRIGGPDGTAAVLGMKRTTLYTRMKRLGMT
jgi:transcriptional regulator of acetoin/glycerol metabolism